MCYNQEKKNRGQAMGEIIKDLEKQEKEILKKWGIKKYFAQKDRKADISPKL